MGSSSPAAGPEDAEASPGPSAPPAGSPPFDFGDGPGYSRWRIEEFERRYFDSLIFPAGPLCIVTGC